jgi:tetratricopeptide (TPR) repeat protein
LGLAAWPSKVLKPKELLSAAKKALLEAAMTGPAMAIAFGAQTLNISGDRLFEEGDVTGALEEYQKGLTLRPDDLNLLNSLGVCHGRLMDHAKALSTFETILALNPGDSMALFNKGCSLLSAGRLEEAADALKQAADNPEACFEALYQYGRLALELDRPHAALTALRKAAAAKDLRGAVHRALGQAELLAGDGQLALEAFKKAVKHDPDDAQSLSSLGVLFLERANDREVALSLFQRSVEIDPTNSLYRQRLGKLLFDEGDYAAATRHLTAAVEYGGGAVEVDEKLEEAKSLENAEKRGEPSPLVEGPDPWRPQPRTANRPYNSPFGRFSRRLYD